MCQQEYITKQHSSKLTDTHAEKKSIEKVPRFVEENKGMKTKRVHLQKDNEKRKAFIPDAFAITQKSIRLGTKLHKLHFKTGLVKANETENLKTVHKNNLSPVKLLVYKHANSLSLSLGVYMKY